MYNNESKQTLIFGAGNYIITATISALIFK
jgi:hypothetical protein